MVAQTWPLMTLVLKSQDRVWILPETKAPTCTVITGLTEPLAVIAWETGPIEAAAVT